MNDEALIYEHISNRIRELRRNHPKTERKTTQEELASACGIDRSTLTNIELGNQRPPIVVIYRACKFFEIDLDDLLRDIDSVYTEEHTSVEVGNTIHQVSGGKTRALIENLQSKRL